MARPRTRTALPADWQHVLAPVAAGTGRDQHDKAVAAVLGVSYHAVRKWRTAKDEQGGPRPQAPRWVAARVEAQRGAALSQDEQLLAKTGETVRFVEDVLAELQRTHHHSVLERLVGQLRPLREAIERRLGRESVAPAVPPIAQQLRNTLRLPDHLALGASTYSPGPNTTSLRGEAFDLFTRTEKPVPIGFYGHWKDDSEA